MATDTTTAAAGPQTSTEPPQPAALTQAAKRFTRRPEFAALIGLLVSFCFFAYTTRGSDFVSLDGSAAWLNVAAELGIAAACVSLLLIAGEFDLSIGSMVGTASMVVAIGSGYYTWPLWASIAAALLVAAVIGFINGYVVVRTGLPSFIVTLAMQFVLAGASLGLARLISNTTSISVPVSGSAKTVFAAKWGQYSVTIVWWIGLTIIAEVVLITTRFGNWVYATGGNPNSARAEGVPVKKVKIILFMTTSIGAALVGILQTLQFNSGDVIRGRGIIFTSIIAVVIGGALLSGGYGSAVGAMIGAMTYGIVSVGIFFTGWNSDWVSLFLGVLLFLAVLANNYFRKLALARR